MSEIDLDQVMKEIREAADKRRREHPEIEATIDEHRRFFNPTAKGGQDPRVTEFEFYLQQANQEYNTIRPPSNRFSSLKRVVLRLMRPFAGPQVEFNALLVRLLNQAWKIIQEQHTAIQTLRQEPERVVDLVRAMSDLRLEGERTEAVRRLTDVYESSQDPEVRAIAEQHRRLASARSVPAGFDYLLFEDRFRGSEREIKARQAKYLTHFEHHHPVVDLACGRGELLELLKERGIPASGVELNPQMLGRCREKGLDVTEKGVFEYLESVKDESLGGIFAAQLIEHLEHDGVVRLLALAVRKLQTGGLLVLESINPMSLFVFAHSLYVDPTHRRPFHPHALEFLCENLGFSRVSLEFSSPVDEDWRIPPLASASAARFNLAIERLNNLLYGSQDFAVIAHK